jgi:hypothetical protein
MPRIPFLDTLFTWLKLRLAPGRPPSPGLEPQPHPGSQPPAPGGQDAGIAWGAHVSAAFRHKVIAIAARLADGPESPDGDHGVRDRPQLRSGGDQPCRLGRHRADPVHARTAEVAWTPTAALVADERHRPARLCRKAYLTPYAGRMHDLPSAYMAVLYPRAVAKPGEYVLFRKGSKAYKLNRGLDLNGDGQVTKAEAAGRVAALLTRAGGRDLNR